MSYQLEANIPGRGYAHVEIVGDQIATVRLIGPERPGKAVISPGFVDIQLNGFGGVDFSSPTVKPEDVIGVLPSLWKTGNTTFCPTLITNSHEGLLNSIKVLESARQLDPNVGLAIPCYHLEGPFLSPLGSRGAHDPKLMRLPDWNEFSQLQTAAGGRIGIITIAPELPGALDFIRKAAASGVVVAISHTDATPEQIHMAVDAGARLSTHWGNGCPEYIHRHENPLWAQLAIKSLSVSLICDGFHLPSDVIKVAAKIKGSRRCIIVTDATFVASLLPGRYSLVGTEIELLPSGKVVTVDGRCMAGSSITMDKSIAVFMNYGQVSLSCAIRAATENPAQLIQRHGVCSRVEEGQPANLAIFEYTEQLIKIIAVIAGGQITYKVYTNSLPGKHCIQ